MVALSASTGDSVVFFKKLALGQLDDLPIKKESEEVVKHSKVALKQLELSSNALKLSSCDLDCGIERLKARKTNRLLIVIACVFSVLILPVVWALRKIQSNKQINEGVCSLAKLSFKINKLARDTQILDLHTRASELESLVADPNSDSASLQQLQEKLSLFSAFRDTLTETQKQYKFSVWRFRDCSNELGEDDSSITFPYETALTRANKAYQDASKRLKQGYQVSPFPSTSQSATPADLTGLASQGGPLPLVKKAAVALGQVGITNGISACYLIAVLQAIRFNPSLRMLLDRKLPSKEFYPPDKQWTIKNYEAREQLQAAMREVLAKLDAGVKVSQAEIAAVVMMMHAIHKQDFQYGQQCDAQECLQWLMDQFLATTEQIPGSADQVGPCSTFAHIEDGVFLNNSVAYLKPGSGITDSFKATTHRKTQFMLSLEMSTLPGNPTLADAALSNPQLVMNKQATLGEASKDGFKLTDSKMLALLTPYLQHPIEGAPPKTAITAQVGSHNYVVGQAYAMCQLLSTPEMLTIHLKRFTQTAEGVPVKIGGAIDVPTTLDVTSSLSPEAVVTGSTQYELSSVVVHTGGLGGGHYYMYQRLEDNSWVQCNDSSVTPAPNFNPSKESGAYMLMYRQRKTALPA